jgi:serine/threonine protein kinase
MIMITGYWHYIEWKEMGASTHIWSCGVVLFQKISGRIPWNRAGPGPAAGEEVSVPMTASPACARFIRRVLQVDPAGRPFVEELMEDPWLEYRKGGRPEQSDVGEIVDSEKVDAVLRESVARMRAPKLAPIPKIIPQKKPTIHRPSKPSRRGLGMSAIQAPFASRPV